MDSVFSKIIAREIPAKIIYEDDLCLAFHDVNPQAPVHALVIPKKMIQRLSESRPEDKAILGHLLFTANQVAALLDLHKTGFRVLINNGSDGGETVPHLHLHILGGRQMAWPPG